MRKPDTPPLIILYARGKSTSGTEVCQVQPHTILLTLGLFTMGLGAFNGLQYRGSNHPDKPLFQSNMANSEDCMPWSLANASPGAQRTCLLACHQLNQQLRQRTYKNYLNWRTCLQTNAGAPSTAIDILIGKPTTLLISCIQIRPFHLKPIPANPPHHSLR